MTTRSSSDPFGEHDRPIGKSRLHLLGCDVKVDSTSGELLDLAVAAFGGLPKYKLASDPCRLVVQLRLTLDETTRVRGREPPPPLLQSGGGLLCATIDRGNFAIIDETKSRALVCVSQSMLRYPYHARYELIELAFVTLASRARNLVPLHSACIGRSGAGILLMGPSGSGKSTLSLHALKAGWQFMSEDSAFLALNGPKVAGIPNYLHVSEPSLQSLDCKVLEKLIRQSPVIHRRSGARKFEIDLRKVPGEIARKPFDLAAIVFLSSRAGRARAAIRPLETRTVSNWLRREQGYASRLRSWAKFERLIHDVPAYEVRRTPHPDITLQALGQLLD